MKFLDDLSTENIVAIVTAFAGVFALFNEKVREFLLRKLSFLRSKSELVKETSDNTDSIIETMSNRINKLSAEFVSLNEINTETQRENFSLKMKIDKIEYQNKTLIQNIKNKCKSNCFDV